MKSLLKTIFSRRRPYDAEICRLEEAIASRTIDENQRLEDCRVTVERVIGWHSIFDGGDWVELGLEARERRIVVDTVQDFLNLLRTIRSGSRKLLKIV
jgi:hypothetical protein